MFATGGVIQAQNKPAPTASPKIIECIRNGDVGCVSEFLSRGGNAKAVDEKRTPLLNLASERKSATVVRLLINAGADANDGGSGEEPPLCRAALFGRKEIAQALFEAGAKADVICDSDHGDSALMTAIRGVMYGEMPNDLKETLFNPEELRDSADNQSEADEKVAKLRQMLAVSTDDYLEIARMLIARGADVNVVATCDVGESALMYAVLGTNVELVKALLAHGADVKKETPILDVLREIEVEYLRTKLTPVPALSRQQAAMLEWTEKTRSRREEIARLLKATGAKETEPDQEPVDYKGNAEDYAREAFSDVIERNDIKDFERLASAYMNHPLGATVLPNALRGAVIYARVEMVELLLKLGVNPNLPSSAVEDTPLMQAARSANLKLVKLLLDAGAEVNAEDKSGQTALDAVEMYTHSSEEHRTVAAFLKEHGARSGKKKNRPWK
jgi:ankyrin repeat protein